MDHRVRALLLRLARDAAYADAFFADKPRHLRELDLDPRDARALEALDRDSVDYLDAAPRVEPPRAVEDSGPPSRWMTAAIALWASAAYVLLWLWTRG